MTGRPEPVQVEEEPASVEPDDDPDVVEIEAPGDEAHAVEASTGEADDAFTAFIAVLESARLRSKPNPSSLRPPTSTFTALSNPFLEPCSATERIETDTLRIAKALRVSMFEVMLKPREHLPAAGEKYTAIVAFTTGTWRSSRRFAWNSDHFKARAITMRCTSWVPS